MYKKTVYPELNSGGGFTCEFMIRLDGTRLTFAIAANEDVTLVRLLKNLNILNKKYPSTGYFLRKLRRECPPALESTDLPIAW